MMRSHAVHIHKDVKDVVNCNHSTGHFSLAGNAKKQPNATKNNKRAHDADGVAMIVSVCIYIYIYIYT